MKIQFFFPSHRPIRHHLLSLGVLAAALVAQGQVVFTINATPTSNALGYVTTQSYNFSFTLNTAADAGFGPRNPGSATANSNYTWRQEWNDDAEVWTSVAGDGLAGTWVEPSAGVNPNQSADPFSELIASTSSPALKLFGGADVSNVGLTAAGSPVKWIWFSANYTGLTFTNITSTLTDPNSYFADFTGDYAASSTTTGWIHASGGDAFFTINSLSVTASVSAIPEPSTYAAWAGLGALGFAAWRRRTAGGTKQVA